ncbi:MAG: sigma-70 family RNA polymerase sigma factor [Myxococcota bacterium]
MATSPSDEPLDLQILYERHHPMVAWIVRGHVSEHAVDDVVQDVFVAIHRRLSQAPPGPGLRRWIVGVTRSVCHTHRRADARRRARLQRLGGSTPERPCEAESRLDDRAALRRVVRCLQTIEPRQREAFALIELHGLTASEAAEVLGTKLNTVYSRLRLARRKLAQAVAEPREAVTAARRAGRPSPRQARRTWVLVAARVGLGSGPVVAPATLVRPGWGGVLAGSAVAGALVIGLVTGAGRAGSSPDSAATTRSVDAGERASVSAVPPPVITPRSSRGAPVPAPVAALRSGEIPEVERASNPSIPRRRARAVEPGSRHSGSARGAGRGSTGSSGRNSGRSSNPDSGGGSTLGPEARILEDAVVHLDAGDLDEAARRLADHERRFAEGILRDEREQLAARLGRLRAAAVTDDRVGGAR